MAARKTASSNKSTKSRAKTATRARSTRKKGPPNAVELLTKDHEQVKKSFRRFERLVKGGADDDEREALVREVCEALTVHAQVEEEIFYPAAREALDAADLLDEAEVEHASAKDLISQLESMQPADQLFDAKFTVLGEYVKHHIDEEEKQLFPKVKRARMELDELGLQLAQRKAELEGSPEPERAEARSAAKW